MNEKNNTAMIIILSTVCGIVISLFLASFIMPFALMVIIWGGDGKWDDEKKITAVVTEHQETFQDIASQLLAPEQELDFELDIKEKEFFGFGDSRDIEEDLFDLEDIYRSANELKILKIYVVKDSDVDMVIFETYADGMVGSSTIRGFLYLEQDWTEAIYEDDYFRVYRKYDHGEIADHWHYYEMVY